MYSILTKFMNFVTKILRVIQFLGLVYLIIFVICWGAQIMQFDLFYLFGDLYKYTIEFTHAILKVFGWTPSKYTMPFYPLTFYSIMLTFLILFLYNFAFILFARLEKFFIEKSYEKGEKKTTTL